MGHGRPRTAIGTFGGFTFVSAPNGKVKARVRYRDDDGQLRLVQATGDSRKSAERTNWLVWQLKLRQSRDPNATGVDWAGAATFSGALFLLVLALVRGNAESWSSRLVVSLLAGSAALLMAFIAIQRRVREPMLPLGLFRRPSFTGERVRFPGPMGRSCMPRS